MGVAMEIQVDTTLTAKCPDCGGGGLAPLDEDVLNEMGEVALAVVRAAQEAAGCYSAGCGKLTTEECAAFDALTAAVAAFEGARLPCSACDGDGAREVRCLVTGDVEPFVAGVRTLRNGDPGHPDEGGCAEVTSVVLVDERGHAATTEVEGYNVEEAEEALVEAERDRHDEPDADDAMDRARERHYEGE